jgi:hypothetical protein
MTAAPSVPDGVDPDTPSLARIYDVFLGGENNYEVDRQVLEATLEHAPEARDLAWANRNLLVRVCRFLARHAGIDQFLDCGSGLPISENVHQIVQRTNPDATVVYVDSDPAVLAHGEVLLADNDRTHIVQADIFDPPSVLGHEGVRRHLDFSRPLALLQLGTLHYVDDQSRAVGIMRQYVDALPVGSFVGISQFLDPENEHSALARKMEEVFTHGAMGCGTFRTRRQIEELFNGLELLEPGVVPSYRWWPEGPELREPSAPQQCTGGGVARRTR